MKKAFILLVFILFSSILSADVSGLKNAQGLEKVSIQLMWLHQFQFAGYYMAKEKGFYKDSGLDVELKEFKFGMNVMDEVLKGRSAFGVGRSSLIVDSINKEPIVILGAIFQKSPYILISKKSSDFKTIRNLKNKRMMITGDFVQAASIVAMLANQGLSLKDIKQQEHSFDINDLIEGKTDVMAAYRSNEPYQMLQRGIAYQVFDPADYGFDLYSDLFFTSKEELNKHPKRVDAFYKATLQGWEYAFSHIEETAQVIVDKYNTQNKSLASLIYEGEILKTHAYVDEIDLGHIDIEKIRRIADIYFILGASAKGNVLDDLIYSKSNAKALMLTKKELEWIKEHPVVTVGANINYPPFEYVEKMKYKGIVPDYIKIIEEKTGIDFQVETSCDWSQMNEKVRCKELDMLGLAVATDERKRHLIFTKPYLSFPMVIITKDDVSYVPNYKQLIGKKVLVVQGSATHDLLKQNHINIDFTPVSTVDEALKMVSYGKAFAFVGNIATSSYYIKQRGLTNLKVSGDIEDSVEMSMAVRNDWPELVSIMQKAIDSISEKQRNEIYERWLFLRYEQGGVDKNLVIKIISGLLVLFMVSIIWSFSLRNQICKRKLVEQELKEVVEITKKISITDTLTGINNRLYIDQFLEEEIQRSQRYGNDLSVIMLDIDDFKKVNDEYGHLIGDEVLIQFVSIISAMIRKADVFGRWGGEEFLIISTETNMNRAMEMAEEIRSQIESFSFKTVGHKTASIGVASYKENDTITTLISRADTALYKAKNEGKNQVVSF